MSYTTSEKRAALSVLTQQDLTFSRNALGGRNVNNTYAQLRELVLTGFYYEPDAIFALIDISADYWAAKVASLRSQVETLREDVAFLLSKDKTFERIDMLRRAKTTVGRARVTAAVQGKVGARPLGKYRRLVDVALRDMSRQTVQSGAAFAGGGRRIAKARKSVQRILGANFRAIAASHAALRSGLDNLAAALSVYESADALAELSLLQLERLDDMVGDIVDELEALPVASARENMRGYFLELLGGQAVARRLEQRVSSTEPRLEAPVGYKLSASTPTVPPSITGSESAPWPLEQGVSDSLQVDFSGTTVTVDLIPAGQNEVGIEAAEVIGSTFEPFRIVGTAVNPYPLLTRKITSGGLYTIAATNLYLVVDGTTYTLNFLANRTAAQVASDINGAISTVNATAMTGSGQDWVSIAYNNSSPPDRRDNRFMSVVSGVSNAADLAPWDIDGPSGEVSGTRSAGADQRNSLKLYANDSATVSTVTLTAGAWPDYERTAAQVAADITTAGGAAFEASGTGGRITISSELKGEGSLIKMATDGLSGGAETVSHRTLYELGFVEYLESRKSDISMAQVLNVLNSDTTFAAQGIASSSRLTLYEARDAQVTGTNTLRFYVGATDPSTAWDLSQVKVAINTGGNQGTYTLASTSFSQPNLTLTTDRDLRDQTSANRFSVSVISERLSITSLDTAVGSYIQVKNPAATAHTALGFATTQIKGTTTNVLVELDDPTSGWVALDLKPYVVRTGDIIVDAAGATIAAVTGVGQASSGLLSVSAVDSDLTVTTGFTIKSGAYLAYREFIRNLVEFRRGFSSFENDTLKSIGDRLYPQLRIDQPSRDQVIAISSVLDDYDSQLELLAGVLVAYSVTRPSVVTRALRALQEHGHDRARQLLLQGDLEEFFSLTSASASKSQHLMQQMGAVATADINEPTYYDDAEEGELERFMVGFEEDDNPAFEVEDEEEWPDTPFASRPLDSAFATVDLGYTQTSRGGKR